MGDGTWEWEFTALTAGVDADEDLKWFVSVDSTIVRTHQHAAGACKKGPRQANWTTHAIGRPRAGLTTKIHLAADARYRPLAFSRVAGQAGDAPGFTHVMARLRGPSAPWTALNPADVVLPDRPTPHAPPANTCASAASGR